MNKKTLIRRLIKAIRLKEEVIQELNRRILYWHHMYKVDIRMLEEFAEEVERLSTKIKRYENG